MPLIWALLQTISYNTTKITQNMDSGQELTEKLTTIGLIMAVMAAVMTPMNLLTSYYGMNVSDFTTNTTVSLVDFWHWASFSSIVAVVSLGVTTAWVWRR